MYFALLLASSVLGELAGNASTLALLKDWLVVMTDGNNKALVHLNAVTRRIDLLCQLFGPLCFGLLSLLSEDPRTRVIIGAIAIGG